MICFSVLLINSRYPQALHFLELLQYEHFRKELVNAQCAKFIDDQQLLHWQHYQRKRMQLLTAEAEEQAQKQKDKENKPTWEGDIIVDLQKKIDCWLERPIWAMSWDYGTFRPL